MSFEKDTHPNAYAFLMTLMHNTRSNVFLQSMKTNPLSVKKLMKNLILRTLRQLYAVSEIIILIRWVTPPTIVEILQNWVFHHLANSSNFQIPQVCKFLNFSNSSNSETDVLHWLYIYLSFQCPQQHSLIAISSSWFSSKWMWSDPFPLYAKLNPVCS